jgi:hypothetical protein
MENLAAQTPPAGHIEQGGPRRRDTVQGVAHRFEDLRFIHARRAMRRYLRHSLLEGDIICAMFLMDRFGNYLSVSADPPLALDRKSA